MHVLVVPVSVQSKAQTCMTLSSSKAEWVALLEAAKEIMFMIQFLRSMKISIELPVIVRVDSIGTIFMASKISVKCHTKHLDIKYKYENEDMEDGIVKINFVQYVENDSDILSRT